nr:integrase, catalytic region, zinc finger, CCHC-type, peptidase aspartic, catalytic [Tanacetum cinerariifolium]
MHTQTSNTLHNAIMEAGSKDHPPMLAPSNYVQWKSRIKRYIDTKPNHELIHHCLKNPPYKFTWADKEVPISEGSHVTRIESQMETYKTVLQDIRDQLNAEAEAVQIILTRIDNDIYSTVDACPNACEMWKVIERLKQGESINVQDLETNLYWEFGKFTSQDDVTNHQVNVPFLLQLQPEWQRFMTLVKQSQELKTVSYHKLYDILKQHQNKVNEIRAERIAYFANPLVLVAQQQPVNHPQNHPTHYTQNCSTRSQKAATRNRGKTIVNSPQPIYDQEPSMVAEDDETSKDKEIDKLMALISLSFKKIYKPTNNNLRTSSNTSRANLDNSIRINRSAGYGNQRIGNVVGARETVGSMVVQKSGIQCYNCKEFGHVAREYQELEAHYMYMAKFQEVSPDVADFGPIFYAEPLQKVSNDDHYNVFAIENEHPEQSESVYDTYLIEQDEHNVIIDSLDMSYDRERIDQNDDDANLVHERLEQFYVCLNEEMVADLRYFNSLELKVDSLRSKLETQKTQFFNKIDRLSREYYYADHMNTILGVYTELDKLIKIVLFIVDSGCSKHMTGNLKLLINLVEKFLGTVKFGYDQITPILGYGDLVQGAVTIKWVYYVEGLNHNLLSVGQFCDADLEVAFWNSTCYIGDLKGNDLLTDHLCSSYELGKAKQKSFHTKITPSSKRGLQLLHIDLCGPMRVASINGKRYCLVITDDYSRYTWTHFLRSKDETPKVLIDFLRLVQRGLQAQKGFFTKRQLLEYLNKMAFLNDRTVHLLRDGENLNKIKEKGDACIFVGYSTQSRAYRVFNKRTRVVMETIHVNFDELHQMVSDHMSSDPAPEYKIVTTSNELDFLFSPMFDELLNGSSKVVSKSSAVSTADAPNQGQQHTTPLNTHTTPAPTCQVLTKVPTIASTKNMNQAEMVEEYAQVENDEFINIFCTPVQDRGETL